MKKLANTILIAVTVVVSIAALDAVFIIDETQQAIVTQFGRPIGEPLTDPGLNVKVPFIQRVSFFDKRFLEWDGDANQVPTRDKKFIFVDSYARWEITDPLQFFRRLRDERGAQSRISDILDGETRNAVAENELIELVRTSNRTPEQTEEYLEDLDRLEDIQIGRDAIERLILERANERTSDLGIRILDFRFKRINYVDEVRRSINERMISERNQIADLFRSEGQGEARRIEGQKERELAAIQSMAVRESEEIRGRADAEATNIYAAAYNRSRQSRELYAFLKSLETLEISMDENTTIILSTESDLFRFLSNP
ncbi:MAG: protease modulator HflC [Bacteroidetes bacterium]|nr:protease modulator HflC [Bacteroidota bacterium]MCH8523422.1 protease modulator HflC [Balneolales bacterium]